MDGEKHLELRDWFAGQALAGVLMSPHTPRSGEGPLEEHADAVAEQAYADADAMLRRRGLRPARAGDSSGAAPGPPTTKGKTDDAGGKPSGEKKLRKRRPGEHGRGDRSPS